MGSTDGDIRGSRRRLENLVTTAAIQNDIYNKRSESLAIRLITAASQDQAHGVYLRRHFDGTPLFLLFGQLEHAMQSGALQTQGLINRHRIHPVEDGVARRCRALS